MKPLLPITLTALAFVCIACDKEKVEDAKNKTVDAAKSVGELTKDTAGKALEKSEDLAGKALEKGGDLLHKAGDKLKEAKEKISDKSSPQIEAFKTRLNGYSEMMKNMQGAAGDNPAKLKEMANQLMAKLGTITTDGLPEDTRKAFNDYHNTMRRILQLMMSIPEDPAAQAKWELDHGQEMQQLEKDSVKAAKDLKDAAASHGLNGLDLGEK